MRNLRREREIIFSNITCMLNTPSKLQELSIIIFARISSQTLFRDFTFHTTCRTIIYNFVFSRALYSTELSKAAAANWFQVTIFGAYRELSLPISATRTAELVRNFLSLDYTSLQQIDARAVWNYRVAAKYAWRLNLHCQPHRVLISIGFISIPGAFAWVQNRRVRAWDAELQLRAVRIAPSVHSETRTYTRVHDAESKARLEVACSPLSLAVGKFSINLIG